MSSLLAATKRWNKLRGMIPTPIVLGQAHQRYGPPMPFAVAGTDRLSHLYVTGQTGTGKSTLLMNAVLQDAQNGTGFCLIDPHGDLVTEIHHRIDRSHFYWDVADPACALGYNPLQRVSAPLRPLVASGIIDTLKKQWPDAWGARMEHLLRYAILALLERPESDLRDLMKLFVYPGFRRQVLNQLTDEQARFFWKEEYARMNYQSSADGVSPIANKLGAFLASPTVRTALCEPASPIRFRQVMDAGEVLLINLAKGKLGTDVSNVLGGLVTSSLLQAAFTRHTLSEPNRRPFFLYVDEFHNLTTQTFSGLLSEARKYGLGVIMAHQYLNQIDRDLQDAIFGNVGSMVVFRVGPNDAPVFARLMPQFAPNDFQNRPNHEATAWVMHQGARLKPFTATMGAPYQTTGYPGC